VVLLLFVVLMVVVVLTVKLFVVVTTGRDSTSLSVTGSGLAFFAFFGFSPYGRDK
jgi:hypothetical protein